MGCSNNKYEGFKNIELSDVGSFYVPQDWVCIREDDVVYFIDESFVDAKEKITNCYLIGTIYEYDKNYRDENPYLAEIEEKNLISSEVFSNSVIIGEKEYQINGELTNKYFMDCYISSETSLAFVVWDDSINYEVISEIGKSFKRNN